LLIFKRSLNRFLSNNNSKNRFVVLGNHFFIKKKNNMNLIQEDWAIQLEEDRDMILDVRTEDEFNEGIIATAINFDIHSTSFCRSY
jgi:predicted sulfurtransferase